MAVKVYKPTTPGRRKSSVQDFSDITKTKPEKSLLAPRNQKAGRNNAGKITIRHRGGGAKRRYRMVDFLRTKFDAEATVTAIEYDPNRGPRIALIEYTDGTKSYILGADGLKVGDKVMSSQNKIDSTVGSRMPVKHIPVGLFTYNIELSPGKGGQIVRGAGTGAQLQVLDAGKAQFKLPSGEVRVVQEDCMATVGRVGNADYKLVRYGKAGRMRLRGRKPTVRGKAMNPVDHPHGGGEAANGIGLKRRGPQTPWGKKALGVKTRKPGKASNKFIVERRKKKKR